MIIVLSLLVCAMFIGCAGKSAPSSGPADAVLATFKALEAQDSARYLESLAEEKRNAYVINPEGVRMMLNQWKGRHANVHILSVNQSGDTQATVMYNIAITGRNPEQHDSVITRTYVENGEWKHGY